MPLVLPRDFPSQQGIAQEGAEALLLFLFRDVQPELDQHLAVVRQPALEFVDLRVGLTPDFFLHELVAPLDQHAAVPRVIEDCHLAVVWQHHLIAPQEVISLLEWCRRAAGIGPEQPRIELFREFLDDMPFAGGVPAFQANHDRDSCLPRSILQPAQLLLQLRHGLCVGSLGELFLQVNRFQHDTSRRGPLRAAP